MAHKNHKQHTETFKAKRRKNTKEGRCVDCWKKCKSGTRCKKHNDAHTVRQQRYYERNKDALNKKAREKRKANK